MSNIRNETLRGLAADEVARFWSGVHAGDLAREFGVKRSVIFDVVKGRRYAKAVEEVTP